MSDARKKSSGETTTCSWCSAVIPVEAATCPSCGAALRDAADGDVAGVTQVDLAATSRLARMKPPGRIAMWLGAERTTDNPALAGRIEPPSDEVRKEMLRLELAAIDAEIQARNAQLEAERILPPEDAGAPASEDAPGSEAG
jgi:RNA polymerase subunit RPABC4/transcription elongation factor Spt4